MTSFLPIDQVTGAYLNASTPLGLFRGLGFRPALFWITEHNGVKAAAVLVGAPDGRMTSWPLKADVRDWSGVHLGPVALEIDHESAGRAEAAFGSIMVAQGTAHIVVQERFGVEYHPVAAAARTDAAVNVCFTRWRLVQRDRDTGQRIVLFEHDCDP